MMLNHIPRALSRFAIGSLLAIVTLTIIVQSAWSQYPGAAAVAPEFALGLESITEAQSRQILSFIAGPNTQGRNPAQPGFAVAAGYAARFFEEVGLQAIVPDGSYFQRIDLIGTRRPSFRLQTADGTVQFSNDVQGTMLTQNVPEQDVSGIPVFVYLKQGATQLPDGVTLADLEDKILVVNVVDQAVTAPLAQGQTSPELDALEPLLDASKLQVFVGNIAQAVTPSEHYPPTLGNLDPIKGALTSEWNLMFAEDRSETRPQDPTTILIAEQKLPDLLRASGASIPVAPTGKLAIAVGDQPLTLTIEGKGETRPVESMNVVAWIEGSDPQLKSEVVGIGAHLDHLGVFRDGSILNGADDNGSGSTALLNVARALAVNPTQPKRSVLLFLFTGEEEGTFGSEYYVKHPLVSTQRMVAYLNIDMVGRNAELEGIPSAQTNQLLFLEGANCSPNLKSLIEQANQAIGFELRDTGLACDTPLDSDQESFVAANIPVAYFFSGFHRDVHQPTDTVDKINFQKLTNASRLVYLTAQEIANQETLNLRP